MSRKTPRNRIRLSAITLTRVWRPLFFILLVLVTSAMIYRLPDVRQKDQSPMPAPELNCEIPGPLDEGLYGTVPNDWLPWARRSLWPSDLAALQTQYGAYRLIAAFRTTLPEPFMDEAHNVANAANYLRGTVLHQGERMSLNKTSGPYTAERGYLDGPMYSSGRVVPSTGGGVCKVATTLYNAATLAGLTIVERHPHSMQVPYVPAGRDAAVAWGYKDLKIANPYATPVVIWAEAEDSTLYVAVYGDHDPPQVAWHHEELGREPKPTLRNYSADLAVGEEVVINEGFDGVTVRTWLILTEPDGTTHRRDLAIDYYRPMPRVIQFGGS